MKKDALKALNALFGIPGFIEVKEGPKGLHFVHIKCIYGEAQLSLYGGQVTHYKPHGEAPFIWMSPLAEFKQGKAIRGGVPICWPWFGAHTSNKSLPQHGIARTANWSLVETCLLDGQKVKVTLRCDQEKIDQLSDWKGVKLMLSVTLGETLTLELCTHNDTNTAKSLGCALHTYLHVKDIHQVILKGLEATHYLDKLDGYSRNFQAGAVVFKNETDREYLNTKADCILFDRLHNRSLKISKGGSNSTVVWNPWKIKAALMTDFPDTGYLSMLCVEAAMTESEERILLPNECHVLSQSLSLL